MPEPSQGPEPLDEPQDPFHSRPPLGWDGGEGFAPMLDAMRHLQDLVTCTSPPAPVIAQATEQMRALVSLLGPYETDESHLIAGRRHDLAGRGHTLWPPYVITEHGDGHVRAQVRFAPYFLGGNGAAHGGTIPLLFDEILGRVTNHRPGPRARTAYLHVNYRAIVPIGADLIIEATLDRTEGRKLFCTGRLLRDSTVLSDAEALFLMLIPGQP